MSPWTDYLKELEKDFFKDMTGAENIKSYASLAAELRSLPTMKEVMFTVHMVPNPGDHMVLIGDHPTLGRWFIEAGVSMAMRDRDGPIWRATALFPLANAEGLEIRYKFVRVREFGRVIEWEKGADRTFMLSMDSLNPPLAQFNENGPGPCCPKQFADDCGEATDHDGIPPVVIAEVKVEVTCSKTFPGDVLRLVGSKGELGNWIAAEGVNLTTTPTTFPRWTANITLPLNETVEWKLIIVHPDGSVTWETGSNRSIKLTSSPLGNTWSVKAVFDSPDTRITQVPLKMPPRAEPRYRNEPPVVPATKGTSACPPRRHRGDIFDLRGEAEWRMMPTRRPGQQPAQPAQPVPVADDWREANKQDQGVGPAMDNYW